MKTYRKLVIADVCEFIGGSQPPKTKFSSVKKEGYIRFIQTRDFKSSDFVTYIPKHLTTKFFDESDIMIGRYGPPIFQIFRGMEGAYNVALLKAKPRENILNDYLYYFLKQKSLHKYVDNLSARTGGQTGVDLFSLYKYPINLPSLDIQRDIAKILSNLDAKIELNNKINKELEAMAKTLYNYWFVQFNFPDENGKLYKTSGGKMVWSEELRREIPEGWESGNIMVLAELIGGGTPKTNEGSFWNGKIPFYTPADSENSIYVMSTKQYLTDKGLKSCSTKLFAKGTVFITARGTVGKINVASEDMGMNQSCYAIQAKLDVNSSFLYFYANNLVHHIKAKASGSIFNALVTNDFKFTAMVVPPTNLIAKFGEFAEPIFSKVLSNKKENLQLSSLRDWLLPMLMNGQVRVADVELEMVAEPDNCYTTNIEQFQESQLEEDYYKKRKALAIYIINQSLNDKYFGDTKLMKLLHLADYHVVKRNFGQNYYQNVAGPFDGEFKNKFIGEVQKEGMYKIEKPNTKYIFKKGPNHSKTLEVTDYFSALELQKVDFLVNYFSNENYERPEIFSTLYAVWNNRLIKGEPVTNQLLKQDFLDWDEGKKKYKDQVIEELDNMKMIGIVPDGWGKYICKAQGK